MTSPTVRSAIAIAPSIMRRVSVAMVSVVFGATQDNQQVVKGVWVSGECSAQAFEPAAAFLLGFGNGAMIVVF